MTSLALNPTVLIFENEDEEKRAKEIAAKLLACWGIPRSKGLETKLDYDFIANHKDYFDTVLKLCGHGGLTLSTARGREVAYVTGTEKIQSRRFLKDESIVILRLLQEYLRSQGKATLSSRVEVFAQDILENVNATRRLPMDLKELQKILDTLDGYNFVQMDLRRKNEFGSTTIISIMPTIACMLPYKSIESIDIQLADYAKETTRRKSESDGTENIQPNGSDGEGEN